MSFRSALRNAATSGRLWLLAAAGTMLAAAPQLAVAGACGDDIDGRRVACACGDNVVTDTVLWATDPVVTEPCADDGLTIVAARGAESLTLNLGGQSIVGRGHGTGIRVARGGRLGAVILGGDGEDPRAEIARFRTGIRASGRDVLREIRSIDIHDNTGDGLHVRTSGVRVDDVRSERNGRSGLALTGHGNDVSNVTANGNTRDGVKVRGSSATIDAETRGNGRSGAALAGRGHHVEGLRTAENGAAGVTASGRGHDLDAAKGFDNATGMVAGPAGVAP